MLKLDVPVWNFKIFEIILGSGKMTKENALIPEEKIKRTILLIRKMKIILDKDLAELYCVQTRDLNKAVRRNSDRFPNDFMFQLTQNEFKILMFHFGTSRWGGTRKPPYAFTELGVAMLSSVLNSKRAIQVNIQIMRAFVALRNKLIVNKGDTQVSKELARKYDKRIGIFRAIQTSQEQYIPNVSTRKIMQKENQRKS
jgi:hypothetical protein